MLVGSTHGIGGKVETETLSVVVAQLQPINSTNMDGVNQNIDQLINYMDKAICGFPGLDLFVSPEFGVQGIDLVQWRDVALDEDGKEIQRLKDKCKELQIWGIFGPVLKSEDRKSPRNTAIMINDKGEIVHRYTKMNPWLPNEETYPGEECPVTLGPKGSRIATIICADGDYPEIWREAAYNGANVIVRISHYMAPWDKAWEITNKAGAYFNQTYVVACNCVGIDDAYVYFGRSMVLTPDGDIVSEAPMSSPWLLKADLYPGLIDQIREKNATSNLMYSFKHRGGSCKDLDGNGDTKCRYGVYSDWK